MENLVLLIFCHKQHRRSTLYMYVDDEDNKLVLFRNGISLRLLGFHWLWSRVPLLAPCINVYLYLHRGHKEPQKRYRA